ncbi:MAG: hypothetical protein ACI4VU_06770 [Methanobrevibacter sp.]
MRKKLFMIISLVTFYCLFSCYSQTFENYNSVILTSDKYSFSDNWSDLSKEGKVYLFYKLKNLNGTEIITNFFYSLETNEHEFLYLGGFDVHKGFINNKKKQFVKRSAVSSESQFIKEDLVGISKKLLDEPFVIIGIIQDADDKQLYETESLEFFYIDEKNKSIIEWFPEF